MGNGVKDVQIVISAKDMATDMLKQIGGTLAAVFSIREVYEFGKAAVESASTQEEAETKLTAALGKKSEALLAQAEALQKTTKYSDTTIITADAQVAAFTKNEDVIRKVTAASMDFATAKGMDLVPASDLVTKSIYGEVNMLGRYGISVSGAAGSTERLNSVLQGLKDHFGGQTAAQAGTFAGQVDILKNSYNGLLTSIGNIITQNPAVMGAMGLLEQIFGDLSKSINDNQVSLMEFVQNGLGLFIRSMGLAINTVYAFELGWYTAKNGIQQLAYQIVAIVDAIIQPLNQVGQAMEAFSNGKIKNPLAGLAESSAKERLRLWNDTAANNKTIDDLINKMTNVDKVSNQMADQITAIEIPAIKAATAAVKGKGDAHKATSQQIAEQMAAKVNYLKELSALYAVYGATKAEQQQMDLSTYDAETSAKIAAIKAQKLDQNTMEQKIYQEEINRAMGRQVLVEQQLQANETLMESMTRMASAYDMAGGIVNAKQDEMSQAAQAWKNIQLAANKAMQDQLLRLVEAHKFSATAIGQAVLQQAKMEVLAIAAKSAVYAIFYTALGLGLLAMGDPRSGAAFAAAVDMGLVPSVAALSMATALNAITGPGAQAGAQGSNPSNPTYTSPVTSPTVAQQQQTQQITINVANGQGSKEYWDDLTENTIVPALNRAGDRNVQLSIQTA